MRTCSRNNPTALKNDIPFENEQRLLPKSSQKHHFGLRTQIVEEIRVRFQILVRSPMACRTLVESGQRKHSSVSDERHESSSVPPDIFPDFFPDFLSDHFPTQFPTYLLAFYFPTSRLTSQPFPSH
ncbi:unnamed protein product [Pylaiella littoralis]